MTETQGYPRALSSWLNLIRLCWIFTLQPSTVPNMQVHNASVRMLYKAPRGHIPSVIASPFSLRMLCTASRRCTCIYIGETGRRLRKRFSEHLRRSHWFPVAEQFNSDANSLDDIMVCGMKQCNGNNTRKQQEMKLNFELSMLFCDCVCIAHAFHVHAQSS